MKRKFTKQIKEDGVTVKLPMETDWHVVDYDEHDDDLKYYNSLFEKSVVTCYFL